MRFKDCEGSFVKGSSIKIQRYYLKLYAPYSSLDCILLVYIEENNSTVVDPLVVKKKIFERDFTCHSGNTSSLMILLGSTDVLTGKTKGHSSVCKPWNTLP